MKIFNRFLRTDAARALVLLVMAAAAAAACTTVDDSLGSNLVPENQQMLAGYTTLPRKGEKPARYVETRLFQSDSLVSSNLSYGYMGSELNDTLGLRTAGFLTQFLDKMEEFRPGFFGYRPFVDSAVLKLSISQYGADTLTPQQFGIYEIVSNDYLKEGEADTVFYLNFNPDKYVGKKPLFRFTFPDGKRTKPSSANIPLEITDEGEHFIKRLMLEEGPYKGDYSIYTTQDSLVQWLEEFKGLYIRPESDQAVSGKGTIYATDLLASSLVIYGRNRVEADPSLVQDTIRMNYAFYHTGSETHGNVSVNTLRRDYGKGTMINPANVKEPTPGSEDTRKPDSRLIVEGLGGIATEITFTQQFFDELEALIAGAEDKQEYSTLAFSKVRMLVYFSGSDYDPSQIDPANPGRLIAEMDAAPKRIGLYTDYKKLTPIADYNYTAEKNNSSYTLAYDGYLKRSRGCYAMDITGYAQTLWNSYLAERRAAEAENRPVELDNVKNRTIYAGLEAYSLYSSAYGVLQGMTTDEEAPVQNTAPIRFEIAYNLIK